MQFSLIKCNCQSEAKIFFLSLEYFSVRIALNTAQHGSVLAQKITRYISAAEQIYKWIYNSNILYIWLPSVTLINRFVTRETTVTALIS